MKKKIFITVILIFSLFYLLNIRVFSEELIIKDSKSAILIESNTGKVLHEYNSHTRLIPASITKIVTLKLVFDSLEKGIITKNTKVVCSNYASSMGGSQIYLSPGEEMIVDDLIKSVAIASANDAAVALAEHLAGTEDNFVKQMNKEVDKLGLKDTHFSNCTGLPINNHYTTAYDIAMLAKDLINTHEEVLEYTSIYEAYIRENSKKFWLVNTNKMVKNIPGVDGLKTGYLSECGYNLVCTKKENGMRLISVVMGASTINERTKDTLGLLNFGFNSFELVKLFSKGDIIKTIEKVKIEPSSFNVVCNNDVYYVKNRNEKMPKITYRYEIDNYKINHYQKENIGRLIININEEEYVVNLNLDNNVKKVNFMSLLFKIIKSIF